MKFTLPNKNGILCNKMFDSYAAAKEHFKTEKIVPVIGLKEWERMPKDYKGFKNGKPYCLYLTDRGTIYGEVFLVYDI